MNSARFFANLFALGVVCVSAVPSQAEIVTMPVPLQTIYPGQPLRPEDFLLKSFSVNDVARQNFAIRIDQLLDKEPVTVLMSGRPIALKSIKQADDVKSGKLTVARFVEDGIEIQGVLMPRQNGSAGQIIEARNPTTGVVLNVMVLADGTLSVAEK